MAFSWPKRGDRLFELADSTEPLLATSAGTAFTDRAGPFKAAADAIIEHIRVTQPGADNAELILPICYLYRHSIELRLKDLVRLGIQAHVYSKEAVEEVLRSHSLARLWTRAREIISDRWPNADDTPLRAVESLINEFHQLDRTGQVLRYEVSTSGARHSYEPIETPVSGENLLQTMEAVFNFLDGCYDGIDDGIQAMRESF